MKNIARIATRLIFTGMVLVAASAPALAAEPTPKGFASFGPDQTIADIGKIQWQPLKEDRLPPGMEIAVLRGDLGKGGGEILLRLPANYTVPNHSHTSDELYIWIKGAFTYIAGDGKQAEIDGPAYISLPGHT